MKMKTKGQTSKAKPNSSSRRGIWSIGTTISWSKTDECCVIRRKPNQEQLRNGHSAFPSIAIASFWLRWLEEIIRRTSTPRSSKATTWAITRSVSFWLKIRWNRHSAISGGRCWSTTLSCHSVENGRRVRHFLLPAILAIWWSRSHSRSRHCQTRFNSHAAGLHPTRLCHPQHQNSRRDPDDSDSIHRLGPLHERRWRRLGSTASTDQSFCYCRVGSHCCPCPATPSRFRLPPLQYG